MEIYKIRNSKIENNTNLFQNKKKQIYILSNNIYYIYTEKAKILLVRNTGFISLRKYFDKMAR